MPEDIDRKLIDKRVAQRYLRKGTLDEKDYERYVKSLPDLAGAAVPIESDLELVDDDDEPEEVAQAGQPEPPQAVAQQPAAPLQQAQPKPPPEPQGG